MSSVLAVYEVVERKKLTNVMPASITKLADISR